MAETCLKVEKKNDFGERSTVFRSSFIANDFGIIVYVKNVFA